jgi:hypothetical protein
VIDSVQSLATSADQVIGLAVRLQELREVLGLDPMEARVVSRMEQTAATGRSTPSTRTGHERSETALPVMRDLITDAFIDEALIGFDIDEAGISADTPPTAADLWRAGTYLPTNYETDNRWQPRSANDSSPRAPPRGRA